MTSKKQALRPFILLLLLSLLPAAQAALPVPLQSEQKPPHVHPLATPIGQREFVNTRQDLRNHLSLHIEIVARLMASSVYEFFPGVPPQDIYQLGKDHHDYFKRPEARPSFFDFIFYYYNVNLLELEEDEKDLYMITRNHFNGMEADRLDNHIDDQIDSAGPPMAVKIRRLKKAYDTLSPIADIVDRILNPASEEEFARPMYPPARLVDTDVHEEHQRGLLSTPEQFKIYERMAALYPSVRASVLLGDCFYLFAPPPVYIFRKYS